MITIIEDTRNQIGKHKNIHDFCDAHGIQIIRSKMVVGDYTLPTDQRICIDTKADMNEVYTNLTGYQRFHNEYTLAESLGIHLVILIEEPNIHSIEDVKQWKNPLEWKYRYGLINKKPRGSAAIAKQMQTIQDNHNMEWMFCAPADTGQMILKILGVSQ